MLMQIAVMAATDNALVFVIPTRKERKAKKEMRTTVRSYASPDIESLLDKFRQK